MKGYFMVVSEHFPTLCFVNQAWLGWAEKHAVLSVEAGNVEVCLYVRSSSIQSDDVKYVFAAWKYNLNLSSVGIMILPCYM